MGYRFRLLSIALLAALVGTLGVGCEEESGLLTVSLITDLEAGREFDTIVLESLEPELTPDLRGEFRADTAANFLRPVWLDEFAVPLGTRRLEVTLMLDGERVVTRAVSAPVQSRAGITALITRSCVGVVCDDPSLTTCAGGVCVSPECSPEHPEACETSATCDEAACVSDGCAMSQCVEGFCLTTLQHTMCGGGDAECGVTGACLTSDPCPGGCDDGDACTVDSCEASGCVNQALDCDDGDLCTVDSCEAGACVREALDCDDGDPDTEDSCGAGGCEHRSASCDDGDVCTSDTIVDGVCQSTPLDCDDGDPCTTNSCEAGVGCVATALSCDDGDVCTNDSCGATGCENVPRVCDDGDPATADSCGAGGCVFSSIECDDSNACSVDTLEGDGSCSYATLDCEDMSACTTNSCDMATGCVSEPITCDDGDMCTVDACDPASGCTTTPLSCDDGDVCTTDACDAASGCSHAPRNCDDGDPCTVDTCGAGGCVHTPMVCDDGNACTDDMCVAGSCQFEAAVGRGCDDGLFCTEADACDAAGSCVGVARDCATGVCKGRCDEATDSCVSGPAPVGSACGDGTCGSGGVCQISATPTLSAGSTVSDLVIDNELIVIGDRGDEIASIITPSGGGWSVSQTLSAGDTGSASFAGNFGCGVDASGDRVLVAGCGTSVVGAVHLFQRTGGGDFVFTSSGSAGFSARRMLAEAEIADGRIMARYDPRSGAMACKPMWVDDAGTISTTSLTYSGADGTAFSTMRMIDSLWVTLTTANGSNREGGVSSRRWDPSVGSSGSWVSHGTYYTTTERFFMSGFDFDGDDFYVRTRDKVTDEIELHRVDLDNIVDDEIIDTAVESSVASASGMVAYRRSATPREVRITDRDGTLRYEITTSADLDDPISMSDRHLVLVSGTQVYIVALQ